MSICTPAHAGQNVKTSEFLKLDYESQDYFFGSTIWTAAVIATQIRQDLANCIADWYTNDPAIIKERNAEILRIMKGLPDSYPSGIVVAVLQKNCGKFGK
ncbi:MAG: hypothetical protein JKY49_07435 [Cohaesibacteraceae bacterium]|nr:hypothetical protein [Cohaesibacteraceae bacterium]